MCKSKIIILVIILGVSASGFVLASPSDNVWGYAWSENIGWLSFNCTNIDSCATSDYGVNIDENGDFSGYAWSENIGWVDFSQATVDLDTKQISGWARALAGQDAQAGGWDGWIKLRDTSYGLEIDDSVSPAEFRDWAWGSDDTSSTAVIGWLDFDGRVYTSFGFNEPPNSTIYRWNGATYVDDPGNSWQKANFTRYIYDYDADGSLTNCEYYTYDNVNSVTTASGNRTNCENGAFNNFTISVGDGQNCPSYGENACTLGVRCKDNDAEFSEWDTAVYHIDWTSPAVGATSPSTAKQGENTTFSAPVSDNLELNYCWLYIDHSNKGLMTISPWPCENGESCTASKDYTFAEDGIYSMYAKCADQYDSETGQYLNISSGPAVDVFVETNHLPVITDSGFLTSPCPAPTTQTGCNVNFFVSADDPDGDTLSYLWDFNDSATSSEQNPSYHFNTTKTYNVSITVSDGRGGEASITIPVSVSEPTLEVSLCAGQDASVYCANYLTGSTPFNGVDLKAIVTGTMFGTINYKFDCNNDEVWELEILNSTEETYVAIDLCNYSAISAYTAKVHIDRGTGSAEQTAVIEVLSEDIPPTCEIELQDDDENPITEVLIDETFYIYTGDSTDDVNIDKVRFSSDDFQDGSPTGEWTEWFDWAETQNKDWSFALPGDMELWVEIIDTAGQTSKASSAITARLPNRPPTAAIDCGICLGYTGCVFTLINQSSDPDGLSDISFSQWDIYGWGAVPDLTCVGVCNFTPSALSPAHYTVELYIEDYAGESDSTTENFTILQDAIADFQCSLKPDGPWQDDSCQGLRVTQGEVVYFKDISTPSDGAAITNWQWTFEDGDPDTSPDQHPFATFQKKDFGSGYVCLTITDDAGREDSQCYQLQITLPLPKWQEIPPY